ncbi:glyoxalase [Microbacterium caowuchunii]|uniref:VOC family protein n=1 Tax=Microbacterium caowuchunii TaxID=2614638 RepID=UPI001247D373|nr:VOC family protein [Microbacterium caowuchunii]QEW01265.1 glyoxalase [Microbacterium caowuchunii]
MTATSPGIRSLGYAITDATDLDAWVAFASDLLGLQLSERTNDRLVFRMDEKEYRLIVNKAETNGIRVLGWEVGGPEELAEIVARLQADGHEVAVHSREEARQRSVSALASFPDPDGIATYELYYGLRESQDRFVSPAGATFVTGEGGLGHAFLKVNDVEVYRRLFVDILGFRLSDHIETGPDGSIDLNFFHCNPRHHTVAFAHLPGHEPVVGHLMFEVSDLDIIGRAWDKVDEEGAAPVLSTLGKHTNDKMVSFYVRSPSDFGIEYGTGGIEIDDATWTPTRYRSAHYWGHQRRVPINPADPAEHDG